MLTYQNNQHPWLVRLISIDFEVEPHRQHWDSQNHWSTTNAYYYCSDDDLPTMIHRESKLFGFRLKQSQRRKCYFVLEQEKWASYFVDFLPFSVCFETNVLQWHQSHDLDRLKVHWCPRLVFELRYTFVRDLLDVLDRGMDYREMLFRESFKEKQNQLHWTETNNQKDFHHFTSRCSGRKVKRVRFGASNALLFVVWVSMRRAIFVGGSDDA